MDSSNFNLMQIKRLIVFCAIFFGAFNLRSQSLIGPAGKVSGRFSFSLGEFAINSIGDSSNLVTVGFQQPNLWAVNVIEHPSITTRVFPNPTINSINVEVVGSEDDHSYGIYSLDGKMVVKGHIIVPMTNINLELLSSGQYHLFIYKSGNVVAQFKIIKVQ